MCSCHEYNQFAGAVAEKRYTCGETGFESEEKYHPFADFKCALLVGRVNYLCSTRLHRALSGQADFLDGGQRKELERITEWINDGAVEGSDRKCPHLLLLLFGIR